MRVLVVGLHHLHDLRDAVGRLQALGADAHLHRVAHELSRQTLICCGHAALNMTVCRSARVAPAISRISGSNPRSSMRSASSSNNVETRSSATSPSFMKSLRRRPGVATTTAAPLVLAEQLPLLKLGRAAVHAHRARRSTGLFTLEHLSRLAARACNGARTRTMGRLADVSFAAGQDSRGQRWRSQSRFIVFPEPVAAMPTMSCPLSTTGQLLGLNRGRSPGEVFRREKHVLREPVCRKLARGGRPLGRRRLEGDV